MTLEHQDPAVRWSHHLQRLDHTRLYAVIECLRHSDASGWPASEEAVRLLVAYALSEITALDYARGILHSMGLSDTDIASVDVPVSPPSSYTARAVDAPVDPEPVPALRTSGQIRREDAVHAYVTGQIAVGEFLRIARS